MANSPDKLPDLEGELSGEDLLRHLIAGNTVGYVIAYGTPDRDEFEQFEGAGALGKAVIARCIEINKNIPEAEMGLGTDITFYPVDDDTSEEDNVPDFTPSLLALSAEDANYLLEHMPEQFLNQLSDAEEPS